MKKAEAVLMVNSKCNKSCKMCYLEYTGERSPEDALDAVKSLKEQGFKVTIAGSETLFNPGYLKAYKEAGQDYLLTNGLILLQKPELFSMMRDAGIKMLGFSIQFNNPELECLPESVVAEVIYASQEQGFKTQVKTIITPNNYRSVEEICTRAVNYGIDSQKFLRFVESGRAKGQKQYLITSEQKLDFFNQVVEARKKFPKTVLDIIMYGGFGPRPGSKGEPLALANKYCPGGIDFFAISPDNKVYNCPFAMTKPIGEFIDGKIRVERILLPDKRTDCVADLIN